MRSKQATWSQALLTFFFPIVAVMAFRWLLLEPFVIPSGSMIPTLLVHDHIVVNKLAFGIKLPFAHQFLLRWADPHRNQVVVFRYPENPNVYFIKRVLAVAGDRVRIVDGKLSINDQSPALISVQAPGVSEDENDFNFFYESFATQAAALTKVENPSSALLSIADAHWVRYEKDKFHADYETTVPAGHFFVMGDNRDQSSDSRVWGFVPVENLIGTAQWIWLSCQDTLASAPMLCNPQSLRWSRLFTKVH